MEVDKQIGRFSDLEQDVSGKTVPVDDDDFDDDNTMAVAMDTM